MAYPSSIFWNATTLLPAIGCPASVTELASSPATLYPVLARLADERLIDVRETPSPMGPPRRYYRLTPAGQRQLAEMADHWRQLSSAVAGLIEGSGKGDAP